MVFIKTTKTRNVEYIKLVESYWEDGKSKHRVLFNFGRADLIKNDASFLRVVRRLCEIAEIPIRKETENDAKALFAECSEATFYNYGYLAYLKLWKDLYIESIVKEKQRSCAKTQYSISETVSLMAVQHLLEPMSKLSTFTHQNRYFNLTIVPEKNSYYNDENTIRSV